MKNPSLAFASLQTHLQGSKLNAPLELAFAAAIADESGTNAGTCALAIAVDFRSQVSNLQLPSFKPWCRLSPHSLPLTSETLLGRLLTDLRSVLGWICGLRAERLQGN